jgi:hypothetical protein
MSEVAAKPGPTDVTLGPLALALLYGQQFIVACDSVSMNLMTSRAAIDLKTSLTGAARNRTLALEPGHRGEGLEHRGFSSSARPGERVRRLLARRRVPQVFAGDGAVRSGCHWGTDSYAVHPAPTERDLEHQPKNRFVAALESSTLAASNAQAEAALKGQAPPSSKMSCVHL